MSEPLASRITWNPQQCGGKPCIRGMRIRVSDVLELLAQGVSEPTILAADAVLIYKRSNTR